jgi:hypothetical protein
VEAVVAGYDEILEVLRPYLTGDPQRVTSAVIQHHRATHRPSAGAGRIIRTA